MTNTVQIIIQAIDQASGTLKNISGQGTQAGADLEKTFIKVGAALTGIGITAKLVADQVNSAFLDFDKSMTEVKALGVAEDQMERLRVKALEISHDVPVAAKDVSDSMYQMVSVGWEYEEMMKAIDPVTKLAVAGNVDMAEATNAVINAMAAYKETGLTANEATAIFAKGVGVGKWELNDFMQEMMKNINVASELGIGFQELAAYNVALQNSFVDSSEAGSALKMMLMNLVEQQVIDKLAEMGVSVSDASGNFRGMIPILTDLDRALSTNYTEVERNTILTELFGARSVNAANALMRQKDELPGLIEQMGDASFITEQYTAKVESVGSQLQIADNRMTEAKITLGEAMVPATLLAASAMSTFAGILTDLPGPLQTAIGMFLTFGQALIPIGPLIMALPTLISGVTAALGIVSGALSSGTVMVAGMTVALGPLGIAIAAIAAAAVALYAAWKTNFLGIQDITASAEDWIVDRFEGIKTATEPLEEKLVEACSRIGDAFGKLFGKIDEVWQKMTGGSTIVESLSGFFTALGKVVDWLAGLFIDYLCVQIEAAITIIETLVDVVIKTIEFFQKLGQIVSDVSSAIKQGIADAVTNGINKLNEFRTSVETTFNTIRENIKTAITAVIDTIKEKFDQVVSKAKEILSQIITAFTDLVDKIKSAFDAVSQKFQEVFNPVIKVFDTLRDAIQTVIQTIIDLVNHPAVQAIIDVIGGPVSALAKKFGVELTPSIDESTGAIKDLGEAGAPSASLIGSASDKIKGFLGGILGTADDAKDSVSDIGTAGGNMASNIKPGVDDVNRQINSITNTANTVHTNVAATFDQIKSEAYQTAEYVAHSQSNASTANYTGTVTDAQGNVVSPYSSIGTKVVDAYQREVFQAGSNYYVKTPSGAMQQVYDIGEVAGQKFSLAAPSTATGTGAGSLVNTASSTDDGTYTIGDSKYNTNAGDWTTLSYDYSKVPIRIGKDYTTGAYKGYQSVTNNGLTQEIVGEISKDQYYSYLSSGIPDVSTTSHLGINFSDVSQVRLGTDGYYWVYKKSGGATKIGTSIYDARIFARAANVPDNVGANGTDLPAMARGGTVNVPGMALVGERGPELVTLQQGASVIPLEKSGGAGIDYNLLADKIASAITRTMTSGVIRDVHLHGNFFGDEQAFRQLNRKLKSVNNLENVRTGAV